MPANFIKQHKRVFSHILLTSSLLVIVKLLDPMETSKCQPSSSPQGEVLCLGDYLRGKVILYRGKDSAWPIFFKNDSQKNVDTFLGERCSQKHFLF